MIHAISDIALEAGKLMLSFSKPDVYEKEGHANWVTQGDLAVQQFLVPKLLAAVPGSTVFAEEKENSPLTEIPTWVVDPIDGTFNYMRSRKCSCISIALLENREPVLGVVYNPYRQELFTAEKGKGAFLNGNPIHVSDKSFPDALVAFGTSPYSSELAARSTKLALSFLLEASDLRRLGSAAIDLCDLACGRSDIFFELRLYPWDFAASALIIREAGGIFDMPEREEVFFGEPDCVMASNPACYEHAKELILASASK